MLKSQQEVEHTTIIGAGISGLNMASKLAAMPHEGAISIREKDKRIGGRLHSVVIPNTSGIIAELGSMRILRSQSRASNLIDELGLEKSPADHLLKECFHYIRGKKIYPEDYKDPSKIPYELLPQEQGKTPDELLLYAYECLVPGYATVKNKTDLITLLDQTIIDGKSLHDWDLSDLVKNILSKEAYQLILDSFGFEDIFVGHNPYDKLIHNYQDLQLGREFYCLKNGIESLAVTLANKTREQGVTIHTDHELTAVSLFDPNAKHPVFILSFAGKDDVYAKHLVFTISPMALLTIDKNSVLFHDANTEPMIKNAKRSITAVKLFLIYDKPWWHEKGLKNGRVHTSTASRQIYDFSSTERGAMLCIYKDNEPSWPVTSPKSFFKNQEKIPSNLHVPQEVIAAVVEEFRLIFNDPTIQMPHTALWKVWREEQAAFFHWRPKSNSNEVKAHVKNPYPNMFITGDNFGTTTGWVETALEQTEETLKHFKS